MKINFNTAQLSRPQLGNLLAVLDVLQSENQNEIEVTPVEFPLKLKVKLDDDIEMLLGWDPETDSYAGLTTPETVANGVLKRALDRIAAFREKPNPVEPEPEPAQDELGVGAMKIEGPNAGQKVESLIDAKLEPEPEPSPSRELVKSEFGKRVQALAWELAQMVKPLDDFRRGEVWIQFTETLVKEIYG